MKKSFLIAGAGLIAIAVPALATAQQKGPAGGRGAPPAQMKDLTRAELEAKVKERFALLDANKDGVVTKEELTARRDQMRKEQRDRRFKALDSNGDGSISRAEYDAADAKRGPRPDGPDGGPHDGRRAMGEPKGPPPAGAKERQPGTPDQADRHIAGKAGPGKAGPGKMRQGRPGGEGMIFATIAKDGKVTLAQATSAALARFDSMDANKDGVVTAQERMDHRKQMRDQRKEKGRPDKTSS